MAIGDVWRLGLGFGTDTTGPIVWTVRHYRVFATDGTDGGIDARSGYITAILPTLLPTLPTSIKVLEVNAAKATTPTVIDSADSVLSAGTFPQAKYFPPQTCVLIRLVYSGMNPRHPGRWFQPFVPMFGAVADSVTYIDKVLDLANQLTLQFAGMAGGNTLYEPVIYKRKTNTAALVESTSTDSYFYTQRRRMENFVLRRTLAQCSGPF